jgi:hypothetical protein
MADGYRGGSPGARPMPSACMRTFTRSVGDATAMASAPVARPAATLPASPSPPMAPLTGSYSPMRRPPYTTWRCRAGTRPFHRAAGPSSRATVATVPSRPLYLGGPPPSLLFWSCSRTLAMSKGNVRVSAPQAARADAAKLLCKGSGRPVGGGDMALMVVGWSERGQRKKTRRGRMGKQNEKRRASLASPPPHRLLHTSAAGTRASCPRVTEREGQGRHHAAPLSSASLSPLFLSLL